jgi:GNAT superfamily N-acetyltransferase
VIIRRAATIADAAAAAEVYIASRHDAVPAIPPMVHDDDDVRRYVTEVLFARAAMWVVEDGDDVVAMMAIEDDFVDQLYVAPGRTGAGIGTELLQMAKREHPQGLQLWAFQSNVDAIRLYQREGFVAVTRTDGDNEERSPDVLLRWDPVAVEAVGDARRQVH